VRAKSYVLTSYDSSENAAASETAYVGRLTGLDAAGQLLVALPGEREQHVARSELRMDQTLRHAVLRQAEVLLLFEDGDHCRPIVVGILQPSAADPIASLIAQLAAVGSRPELPADADGLRVKPSVQEEIALECGQSSIILRRNGRVVMRGVQIDTCAPGTQRARGGQARLN
jgi:hypothetical protein